ncbi:MAG: hypothetical protein EOP19_22975 [Hyphomicrobiales bacterium]|nr:MAG: hypothetical protein EOP19_22975 [Hyphomicrobiales bacterium]
MIATDAAGVYPREAVGRAIELGALSMILVHNHSAGDPPPQRADIEMKRQRIDAARPLGIHIHDHLVVGREGLTNGDLSFPASFPQFDL